MTALCAGGGTSSIKAGQAALAIYGTGAIASVLNNRGAFWAAVVAPLMGVLQLDLTAMCTTDPPAMPTFTAGDVTEMIAFGGTLATSATRKKFADLVENILWFQLCQCDAGPAPTPPAVPSQPAGLPDTTHIYNPVASNLPCASGVGTAPNSTNQGTWIVLSNPNYTNVDDTSLHFPSGVTSMRVDSSLTPNGAVHSASYQVSVSWFPVGGGGPTSQSGTSHASDGVVRTDTFVSPIANPGGASVLMFGTGVTTYTDDAYIKADAFCGGGPGALVAPCCPADQYQTAIVQQILEYVTLLQRQLAPFAYTAGTVHAGLTGDGEFDIQGLLGAKVALTTIPGSRGVVAGQPDELFDIGFLTFAVDDGYPHSVRIEHNPQVILPARASVFTKLAYSLTPGVVATITELERER